MKTAVMMFAALTLAALVPIGTAEAAKQGAKSSDPYVLKGTSHLPRRAYSKLRKSHTLESRKFYDPALGPRAQGQPFDNGFFFETPSGPFGGYTPYMH